MTSPHFSVFPQSPHSFFKPSWLVIRPENLAIPPTAEIENIVRPRIDPALLTLIQSPGESTEKFFPKKKVQWADPTCHPSELPPIPTSQWVPTQFLERDDVLSVYDPKNDETLYELLVLNPEIQQGNWLVAKDRASREEAGITLKKIRSLDDRLTIIWCWLHTYHFTKTS